MCGERIYIASGLQSRASSNIINGLLRSNQADAHLSSQRDNLVYHFNTLVCSRVFFLRGERIYIASGLQSRASSNIIYGLLRSNQADAHHSSARDNLVYHFNTLVCSRVFFCAASVYTLPAVCKAEQAVYNDKHDGRDKCPAAVLLSSLISFCLFAPRKIKATL